MTAEDDFLASYEDKPDGYLECRGSQHRFVTVEPFRIVDSRNEEGFYAHEGNYTYAYRRMECDRCVDPETGHGMIRHDFYAISSRRGHTYLEKISARYQPPAGYYAPPGLGGLAGNRGLILGAQLDRNVNVTPIRGRGRPRREA
jgi:hypothetical protein